ncbi:hypothetical protein Pen02_63890 [Plantactinospora endophytica]|uniref:Uncharacterized protein n=1 Tax=Plantactinospora endophytica TaxID=673535 RepID=A0ABQ4E9U0_9ACTN|nr:hypothetical protein Pen02_63890 [Plantactinospora endophytica]
MPHAEDHLDHTGHACGGLGVTDVRLDGAEPQRPVRRTVPPVRGDERLGLDRVAETGAGTVRLHGVDVRRSQPGAGQRPPDHPDLRGSVRRGQPVAGAVLVDRRAAQHREDRMAVPPRVAEPFEHEHAGALAPGGAVGRRRERLAPAVGGECALAAELQERGGRRHHGHTAGQRERALALPQRLGGQVERDQRRRAGGVHCDRRTLQPERVGDPAGQHAARSTGAEKALHVLGYPVQPGGVVMEHGPGEHPDRVAAQAHGVDPGALERLPGDLQQQPLLRIHGEGLAGRDAEQFGVEGGGRGQESTGTHVAGARAVRIGVVERLDVPAPVAGEARHRVPALDDQVPQLFG